MNPRPLNREELYDLFGALCNETLTPGQNARLEQLLAVDESARALYFDYLDVHLGLRGLEATVDGEFAPKHSSTSDVAPQVRAVAADALQERSAVDESIVTKSAAIRWRQSFSYLAVIAAIILVMLVIQPRVQHERLTQIVSHQSAPAPEFIATLMKSADCRWRGDHRPQFDGQRLLSRELQLEEGLAELGFDSGVRIVLQGPARLSIESSSQAVLHTGRLVLHDHESAAPFELQTPDTTLQDIGTEYGAHVNESGVTEVHVFSGEVQFTSKNRQVSGLNRAVHEGSAVTYDGKQVIETTLNPTAFTRKIPASVLPQTLSTVRLLAWDNFDYQTEKLGHADGGGGFASPWRNRLPQRGKGYGPSKIYLDHSGSLTRQVNEANNGSALELGIKGGWACSRTLGTRIRLDVDAVYYVSFLLQRIADAPVDKSQYMSVSFRTANSPGDGRKLHFGMTSNRYITMSHDSQQLMVAPQLVTGQTYLYVAKIVAGQDTPDQMMLRVFGLGETVPKDTPLIWNCVTSPTFDETIFDQLHIYCSDFGHYRIDEFRLGTTWESVTSLD